MMPVRVQLSCKKGWRMPPNTVSVARPTKWGNPFSIGGYHKVGDGRSGMARLQALSAVYADDSFTLIETNEQAVAMFREYRRLYPLPARELAALRGKNLACWCPVINSHGDYSPCHADVLISLANDIPLEEVIRENTRRAKGEAL